ncbi:SGNH/GDSL hydrolase family protein [Kiritimatiellaeota bacterium B1221]|nr:SGNH/GDSL hydrolase family protein [Kiritimatiellaeota bacterium B1221]
MTEPIFSEQHYRRSVVSYGNPGRLKEKLQPLNRPLVYGAIGGSITRGAAASTRENGYVSLFAKWLDGVSAEGCECVNAGIGASNSHFGAFRVGRDLLSFDPDIITIEYAVNDFDNPETEQSYESLIRQCLNHPGRPAVILIFTMRKEGTNCQELQARIGKHFHLPMLSYRDAMYPDIETGTMNWADLSPDEVHPNDAGHRCIADMLSRFVEESLADETVPPLLKSFKLRNSESTKFDSGRILDATDLEVISNKGWETGPHKGGYTGYQSRQPGAEICLRFTARYAALGYQKYAGDFGRVEAVLDGGDPVLLEGYYERPLIQAWAGGHTVLKKFVDEPGVKEHTLTLRLREDRHTESAGHQFDIGYMLLSS